MPRDILIKDARNTDRGIVREHLAEPADVGCLRDIVNLFEDGSAELTVNAHQINEIAGIHEARDDPDHEAQRTKIGPHQLLHMRTLHFHRDHVSAPSENTLMHLAQ